MTMTKQDTLSTRAAIARGALPELERYLTVGAAAPDPVSITAATATLNRTTHGGTTVLLNKADGQTITLPAATGSQDKYTIVVQTTSTSVGYVIAVANASDTMIGSMYFCTTTFAAGSTEAAGGTDDTITLVAASGGIAGSVVELTDIASTKWLVLGRLVATTAATVLSAAVS